MPARRGAVNASEASWDEVQRVVRPVVQRGIAYVLLFVCVIYWCKQTTDVEFLVCIQKM